LKTVTAQHEAFKAMNEGASKEAIDEAKKRFLSGL